MKGSVEGSEQSFLFSLYNQLSDGQLACHCGKTVTRQKSDFFTIVRYLMQILGFLLQFRRWNSPPILHICEKQSATLVPLASQSFAARVARK